MHFFGHRDAPEEIEERLWPVLVDLVEKKSIHSYIVGNQGNFNRLVLKALKRLKQTYPAIDYCVVLAYMPQESLSNGEEENTLCPYIFEKTPPRYAIVKRNRWLVARANYVVTYVTHSGGGAAQFAALAKRQGKTVINLSE